MMMYSAKKCKNKKYVSIKGGQLQGGLRLFRPNNHFNFKKCGDPDSLYCRAECTAERIPGAAGAGRKTIFVELFRKHQVN